MHMMTCQILVLGQNTRGVTVSPATSESNRVVSFPPFEVALYRSSSCGDDVQFGFEEVMSALDRPDGFLDDLDLDISSFFAWSEYKEGATNLAYSEAAGSCAMWPPLSCSAVCLGAGGINTCSLSVSCSARQEPFKIKFGFEGSSKVMLELFLGYQNSACPLSLIF